MLVSEAAEKATKPGRAKEPSLIASLLMLGKGTRALMGLKLVEIGLVPGQDELLLALHENDGQAVSFLADTVRVRPSTISKMLDRLEERELLRRFSRELDARRTYVSLTEQGVELIGHIEAIHAELDAELLGSRNGDHPCMSAAEIQRMSDLIGERLRRLR